MNNIKTIKTFRLQAIYLEKIESIKTAKELPSDTAVIKFLLDEYENKSYNSNLMKLNGIEENLYIILNILNSIIFEQDYNKDNFHSINERQHSWIKESREELEKVIAKRKQIKDNSSKEFMD